MISDKPIEQIVAGDLEQLTSNGVAESRSLEYKEALPTNSDQDKREFLADVSSIANSAGGDLIYGVKEKRDEDGKPTGTPEEIVGVDVANLDQVILRLENVLRDGIAPRVPGIRFWPVVGFERGPALVVRIPRSWAAPHMVCFQQSGKFFTRHSGGKHQLDVLELRDAFLNSRSASERAEEWRVGRLGRLVGGAAPVSLSSEKLLCVHAVPYGALFGALAVDLQKATTRNVDLRPIAANSWGHRFNIDGVISVSGSREATTNAYLQLFRNGAAEAIYSEVFFEPPAEVKGFEAGVAARDVAKHLLETVGQLQRIFHFLEVLPPISVFVSLHGMKGVVFHALRSRFGRHTFDRETILLPEIVIDDLNAAATGVLRPALDTLWQAAGLERCFDYAEDGRWAPQ